jgi:hypothetical protein
MAVELNHTIVASKDQISSARSLADVLGLPEPMPFGPFHAVALSNGVTMDFESTDEEIHPQHYAFLLGEDEFDQAFGRIQQAGADYWADPARQQPGEINTGHGGRRVYFLSPDGHFLEILTRAYDSGS